jgi:uncharacterized protein
VKRPDSYVQRTYRTLANESGLIASFAKVKDTDLYILADRDVSVRALELALQFRLQIEKYIERHPEFFLTLSPLPKNVLAPPIVREMLVAGNDAGVGPMAAVAGVIAEYVGKTLLREGCREVMVENGGDLFIRRTTDCTVAIFAGQSPLSLKVGIKLRSAGVPIAVCTSSGTVGHSLSFGEADSVTVIAGSTALADAAATRLGNEVGRASKGDAGIKRALDVSRTIDGLNGVVVVCGEKIGAVGNVELVKLTL